MNSQLTFLSYTLIYFAVKGGLFVALYVAFIVREKQCREKHAQLKVYLGKKRQTEQERWGSAYQLYYNKAQKPALTYAKAN